MSHAQSTLTFITESQAGFTVGAPYDFDLEASGGMAPYTFALTQGALPDGIAISSAGKISGTPTQNSGTTAFIKLSDAQGSHLTQAFDCQII